MTEVEMGKKSPATRLLRDSRAGSAGAMAALVTGLALDLTLAILLGAGRNTDALFVALRIPIGVAVFFPPTAIQVLVPAITKWFEVDDRETVNSKTSSVLVATMAFGSVLAVLGVALSPGLVRVMAPGLGPETHDLAASLSRIAFLMIPPAAMSQVLRAYRHAARRHGLASALQAVLGLTIVTVLLVAPGEVEVGLVVWAYLLGSGLQLLVALFLARSQGFRFRWQFRADSDVRALGGRSLRPLAASGIQLGTRIAEQMVASFLAPGSITILTYANRLISAIGGTLFFKPIVTAFLVPMSKLQALRDEKGVRALLRDGFRLLLFVSTSLALLVAIAAPPFVSGLFALGDLSADQAAILGIVVAVYSASLPTAGTQRILLAVTFARLDTSPYLRNTVYGALANLAFLAVFAALWEWPLKILIVPIAYGLAQIVNTWHAFHVAKRQVGTGVGYMDGMKRPFVAIAISGLTMILTLGFAQRVWSLSPLALIATGLATAGFGMATLYWSTQTFVPGGLRSFMPKEPADPPDRHRDAHSGMHTIPGPGG